MDGNPTRTRRNRFRLFIAVGMGSLGIVGPSLVTPSSSIAWGQHPTSLDPTISARPIEPVSDSKDDDREVANSPKPWIPVPMNDRRLNDRTSSVIARTVDEALATRGSVTFRKTPLSEVVFLLSDLWQINIVAGEDVSGEVSGSFFDAPLSEVLAAALTSSGYSYRKTGSSLIVLSADQIGVDDPSFVLGDGCLAGCAPQ